MTFADAISRACEEPTMVAALEWIAVWDNDRAVRQALQNEQSGARNPDGSQWDTCFGFLFKQVLVRYACT